MSFVAEHRDRFGVEPMLRVLDIPVSTYYGWVAQQRRPASVGAKTPGCWARSTRFTSARVAPTGRPGSTRSCAATVSGPPASGWSG